jgi:hypothetical protein
MELTAQTRRQASGKAIASLVLGIIALVTALLVAFVGIVTGAVGLVIGIVDRRQSSGSMNLAGIICSGFGIVIGIANMALTIYLIKTGHVHPVTH